ncbi:hypothetical protein ACX812_001053 [Staphylococcus pseudintermedius]|nr:hypothetical protein [Staphylococcus pseudintermedius]
MTVKILKIEQSNPHFDEKKKNNGGGYDQPIVTFEKDGIVGTYRNSSCGDFGSRYHLEWNGKADSWGSMLDESEIFEEIDVNDSNEILKAIHNQDDCEELDELVEI